MQLNSKSAALPSHFTATNWSTSISLQMLHQFILQSHATFFPYTTPRYLHSSTWESNSSLIGLYPLRAENRDLRYGGANSHPSRFAPGCKPPQCKVEVTFQWSQHRPQKIRRADLEVSKCMNQICDKGQPWQNPVLIRNESDLFPVIWAMLSVWLCMNWKACENILIPHTP